MFECVLLIVLIILASCSIRKRTDFTYFKHLKKKIENVHGGEKQDLCHLIENVRMSIADFFFIILGFRQHTKTNKFHIF